MQLKFNGKTYIVEAETTPGGFKSTVNGVSIFLNGKVFANNAFSVKLDDRYVMAYACEDENKVYVMLEAESLVFDKIKSEEKSFEMKNGSNTDTDIITPPMPGNMVKVLVEIGQSVNEGDSLVIVEAMKMETTLFSSINGIVTEVNVVAGEQVDSDKVLVVVKKSGD